MHGFDKPLTATYRPEVEGWEVHEPFYFMDADGCMHHVPAGWVSDLASTQGLPSFFYKLFPSDGPYNQAAVLHDYLYAAEIYDRKSSDMVFLDALGTIKEVPRWKIPLMYAAVRVGGGFTYKEHSEGRVRMLRLLSGIESMKRPYIIRYVNQR